MGRVSSMFSGAGSGALAGSALGPKGAIAGGALGLISGFFSGGAQNKRKAAMAESRKRLEELRRNQYAQRMQDLDKAMSYFSPVDDEITRLYGG